MLLPLLTTQAQVARGYISFESMPAETPGMDSGAPVPGTCFFAMGRKVGDIETRHRCNRLEVDDFF